MDPRPDYDSALVAARLAARRMVEAEDELGRIAAALGLGLADRLARDVGVRRSVVVAAAHRALGLVRRHRALERGAENSDQGEAA